MRPVVLLVLLACGCGNGGAASPSGAAANAGAGGGYGGAPGASGAAGNASVAAGASAGGQSSGAAPGGAGGASGAAGASAGGAAGAGGASGAAGGAGSGGTAGAGGAPGPQPPKASGILCVFDYDLTISTNKCSTDQFACRTNTCPTYNWYEQCISSGARHAFEVCVERGAYIGIASHAGVDSCWNDKVAPIISQDQFPALTGSVRYDNPSADFQYPKIDKRDNWNCDTCAWHMNAAFSKPQLVSKVMAHYGMDPKSPTDRAKVIFWDDMPDNVNKMKAEMPEVHTVHVHQNIDGQPNSGGCGILDSDVDTPWAAFPQ